MFFFIDSLYTSAVKRNLTVFLLFEEDILFVIIVFLIFNNLILIVYIKFQVKFKSEMKFKMEVKVF